MKRQPKIVVYQGGRGFYWRLVALNGERVADGAEAYTRRGDARRAARRAVKLMAAAVIVDGEA